MTHRPLQGPPATASVNRILHVQEVEPSQVAIVSGEYFKALRGLLGREAPPASIEFIGERRGVFADVSYVTSRN